MYMSFNYYCMGSYKPQIDLNIFSFSLRSIRAPTAAAFQQTSRKMSTIASFKLPAITNEPNQHYQKGSPERQKLSDALEAFKRQSPLDVPLAVAGKHIKGSSTSKQFNPSSHQDVIAQYAVAGEAEVKAAIDAALAAKESWESLPFADRAAVFLKAADLISGKYRYDIMAATIMGQGKNAWQAEIDAAAELCDFLRFNVRYAEQLYASQPVHNAPGVWKYICQRSSIS
jgi:1-pyrroline-5-carboxylate dehydrogenase